MLCFIICTCSSKRSYISLSSRWMRLFANYSPVFTVVSGWLLYEAAPLRCSVLLFLSWSNFWFLSNFQGLHRLLEDVAFLSAAAGSWRWLHKREFVLEKTFDNTRDQGWGFWGSSLKFIVWISIYNFCVPQETRRCGEGNASVEKMR